MATAVLYSLNKRHNSTLQPTGSGTTVDIFLKGGSDIITPVFTLNLSTFPAFNYILFQGRYYHVTGIRSVRDNLYEISAAVDVLATYKANIQAASPYVLYYTHNNTEISDHRLSAKTTQTTQSSAGNFDNFGSIDPANCGAVVFCVGKDGTSAYGVSLSDLTEFFDQDFFDLVDDNVNNITPIDTSGSTADTIADAVRWFADLLKTEFGCFTYLDRISDNIRSCHILPITKSSIGGYSENITLGKVQTSVNGLRIADRIYTDGCDVTIPWQASDWRRNAPYHEIFLYIPIIGLTSISPSDVIGETSLHVALSMDKFSGDTIITVSTATKTIAYYTTNLGAAYPIGSSNITPLQAAAAIGSAAAAIATSANPALSGAMAGLGLANALTPQATCIGNNGGGAILGVNANQVRCITVFHDTTVTPASVSAEKGTPFNGVLSLASVSGYVQTAGASVSGSMTDTEREEINTLMDGGIFIE